MDIISRVTALNKTSIKISLIGKRWHCGGSRLRSWRLSFKDFCFKSQSFFETDMSHLPRAREHTFRGQLSQCYRKKKSWIEMFRNVLTLRSAYPSLAAAALQSSSQTTEQMGTVVSFFSATRLDQHSVSWVVRQTSSDSEDSLAPQSALGWRLHLTPSLK